MKNEPVKVCCLSLIKISGHRATDTSNYAIIRAKMFCCDYFVNLKQWSAAETGCVVYAMSLETSGQLQPQSTSSEENVEAS